MNKSYSKSVFGSLTFLLLQTTQSLQSLHLLSSNSAENVSACLGFLTCVSCILSLGLSFFVERLRTLLTS